MKPTQLYEREDFTFYRCPRCNAVFSNIIVFTDFDFYDAMPKYCPCCRIAFTNGGKYLSD